MQVAQASERKSQFVANMSTSCAPAQRIIGLTEMMVANALRFSTERRRSRCGVCTAPVPTCLGSSTGARPFKIGRTSSSSARVGEARALIDEVVGTARPLAEQNQNPRRRTPRQPRHRAADPMRLRPIF